jgi:aryl-alcohol dehydrogenase-like predicted oxidoreductase
MEQRALGRTGLFVSALGFGAGRIGGDELDDAAVGRLLETALDAGVTLFDAARSYGRAEARLGQHLARHRARVVLSTKGGYGVEGVADWTGLCVTRGIERALGELRTDCVDVFHLHSCPAEVGRRDDILGALRAARQAGKIRVAAYAGDGDGLAWAVASGAFGAVECSLNVVDQGNLATIEEASRRGIGVIAKRPLANAVWALADEPAAEDTRTYWNRWHQWPGRERPSPAEALRFSACRSGVASAIVGSASVEHLQANITALSGGPLPTAQDATLRRQFRDAGRDWHPVI